MKIDIDKDKKMVTIKVPLVEAKSKSGKMLFVANSSGWQETEYKYKGKTVKINLMVGISTK